MAVQEKNLVNDESTISLIKRYHETKDNQLRNEIVMQYNYIAKTVAIQTRGLASKFAQTEDIINQSILTLIDCVERYDPAKNANFEAYAFMRVKGAVIDYIRKQDWLPRRVRFLAKNIAAAHDVLCNQFMREPTQQELADYMEIPLQTLQKHYSEIVNSETLSFESLIQNVSQMGDILEDYADGNADTEGPLYKKELSEKLAQAIESLEERERTIITLYYYEHLKLSEISEVLGISIQRISQINSKTILKLRNCLEAYVKG